MRKQTFQNAIQSNNTELIYDKVKLNPNKYQKLNIIKEIANKDGITYTCTDLELQSIEPIKTLYTLGIGKKDFIDMNSEKITKTQCNQINILENSRLSHEKYLKKQLPVSQKVQTDLKKYVNEETVYKRLDFKPRTRASDPQYFHVTDEEVKERKSNMAYKELARGQQKDLQKAAAVLAIYWNEISKEDPPINSFTEIIAYGETQVLLKIHPEIANSQQYKDIEDSPIIGILQFCQEYHTNPTKLTTHYRIEIPEDEHHGSTSRPLLMPVYIPSKEETLNPPPSPRNSSRLTNTYVPQIPPTPIPSPRDTVPENIDDTILGAPTQPSTPTDPQDHRQDNTEFTLETVRNTLNISIKHEHENNAFKSAAEKLEEQRKKDDADKKSTTR